MTFNQSELNLGIEKFADIGVSLTSKNVTRPQSDQPGHFCICTKAGTIYSKTNFSSNHDQKKELFLMSFQPSFFSPPNDPAERRESVFAKYSRVQNKRTLWKKSTSWNI